MADVKVPRIIRKDSGRKYATGVRLSDDEKRKLLWLQEELSRREGTRVDLADVQRTAINFLYDYLQPAGGTER